jgi:hypothetical protein
VYAYLNPLVEGPFNYGDTSFEYLPFYIGKGMGGRLDVHKVFSHNDGVNVVIETIRDNGLEPIIQIIEKDISSNNAYSLESKLIKIIGRMDLGTGPLANIIGGVTYQDSNITKKSVIENSKLQLIMKALISSKTVKKASEKLNLSERTLYRYMKSCGIVKIKGNYTIIPS